MSRSLEIFQQYGSDLGVGGLSHEEKDRLTQEIVAEVTDEATPAELIEDIAQKSFQVFSSQKLWLNRVLGASLSNVNVDEEFWFKYVNYLGIHSDLFIHVDAPLAKALTHPLMGLFFETHDVSDKDMYLRDRILVAYAVRFSHALFAHNPLMLSIDQWRKGTAWNAKLGRKSSSLKRTNIDTKEFSYKFLDHAMKMAGPSLVVQIGTFLSFDEVFDRVYEQFWQKTRALQDNDLVQMPEHPQRSKTADQLRKIFCGDK